MDVSVIGIRGPKIHLIIREGLCINNNDDSVQRIDGFYNFIKKYNK